MKFSIYPAADVWPEIFETAPMCVYMHIRRVGPGEIIT